MVLRTLHKTFLQVNDGGWAVQVVRHSESYIKCHRFHPDSITLVIVIIRQLVRSFDAGQAYELCSPVNNSTPAIAQRKSIEILAVQLAVFRMPAFEQYCRRQRSPFGS